MDRASSRRSRSNSTSQARVPVDFRAVTKAMDRELRDLKAQNGTQQNWIKALIGALIVLILFILTRPTTTYSPDLKPNYRKRSSIIWPLNQTTAGPCLSRVQEPLFTSFEPPLQDLTPAHLGFIHADDPWKTLSLDETYIQRECTIERFNEYVNGYLKEKWQTGRGTLCGTWWEPGKFDRRVCSEARKRFDEAAMEVRAELKAKAKIARRDEEEYRKRQAEI
ncbi:hypothetical protein BU26DRAFT_525580 [Trematosphaeria pertusa]|uniref:Uncharacterized protein n=1 Tax=Trematosphaeria pertusa TaxID=390896 RepID=A0A6A6HU48_9PLEO|nr:uncharacterized protein BU26DRAFT_525580 [Trematosphaeria pertusa]KAF2241053.1 hypothetical protein BU26DRAFT_525580 [Trematosphaeria pertusa]